MEPGHHVKILWLLALPGDWVEHCERTSHLLRVHKMINRSNMRLSKLALGLAIALAAAPAFAQSTSSGVAGQVVGADGQPVAGAEVTITHTESGTTSRVTTDASGRYSARGLRVGGPYTITVTKAGGTISASVVPG